MSILDQFFAASVLIQIVHTVEELATGFHKKWYLLKMPFWVFLIFEIFFEGFWIGILVLPGFPNRNLLQVFFLVLMLANGIQHIAWAGMIKRYVPGLITAPFNIIIFLFLIYRLSLSGV